MRRNELNRVLRDELLHVRRGGPRQNELRMVYNIERRHDLAGNPAAPRSVSIQVAIESVRSRDLSFVPAYDAAFFDS